MNMTTREEIIRTDLARLCDLDMLRCAARLSDEAYNEKITIDYRFPVTSLKFTSWYTSACVFIVRGRRYDVVVFRGTKEKMDFLIDAMAVPVWYGGSWCHSGFAFSHWSVWKKVKTMIHPDKPILVTGHSLGAANADKSCDFLRKHKADVHMITFGKPNVHIKGQSPDRSFLKTHLSVVSGSDLVTRIPRLMYRPHPDQNMLYLGNQGNNYINPDRDFLHEDFRLHDSFTDHSMDGQYKTRIDKMLPAP